MVKRERVKRPLHSEGVYDERNWSLRFEALASRALAFGAPNQGGGRGATNPRRRRFDIDTAARPEARRRTGRKRCCLTQRYTSSTSQTRSRSRRCRGAERRGPLGSLHASAPSPTHTSTVAEGPIQRGSVPSMTSDRAQRIPQAPRPPLAEAGCLRSPALYTFERRHDARVSSPAYGTHPGPSPTSRPSPRAGR